jgi:hypothetical protein
MSRRLGREQPPRGGVRLFARHLVYQLLAPRDIVDAEIVALQFDEGARDGGGGVEIVDGIGADEIALGIGQFLFGGAFLDHAGDFGSMTSSAS